MQNLISGERFAAYAEVLRPKEVLRPMRVPASVGYRPVALDQKTVITIRTEADIVQACAAVEDMASALPFSSFEQAFLTAGAASLARMVLSWPAQGEMAISIVGKKDALGIAIVARFRAEPRPMTYRPWRIPGRSRAAGLGWDCFDELGRDGDTVATLVKWSHAESMYTEEPDAS